MNIHGAGIIHHHAVGFVFNGIFHDFRGEDSRYAVDVDAGGSGSGRILTVGAVSGDVITNNDDGVQVHDRRSGRRGMVVNRNSWETVVLNDFAELRKAGLTSPLMREIEDEFKAAG